MNVQDVMSENPRSVSVVDRLDRVAREMWEGDCGFVPVVDASDVLVGVVTDRDVCMASYTRGKPLAELSVTASMAHKLQTCRTSDSVREAMQKMQEDRVHRLPVVDAQGRLVGVLSTNDLVRASVQRPTAVAKNDVLATLAAIGEPRSGGRDFAAPAKPRKRSPRAAEAAASKSAKTARTAAKPKAKAGKATKVSKAGNRKRKA